MGICMSSIRAVADDENDMQPSANVVSINGVLRQYIVPIMVSQVLQSEFTSPSSSSSAFLCNSDCLYFDDYIPALHPDDQLQPGQIYFVLPASKLQYKLSASDMAALAVKASVALQSQNNSRRKKKKTRISPVPVEVEQQEQESNLIKANANYNDYNSSTKKKQRPSSAASSSGLGVSRSGSVKKLQRHSSRRAKLAVRSFRIRLTTIYEGSVLLFN